MRPSLTLALILLLVVPISSAAQERLYFASFTPSAVGRVDEDGSNLTAFWQGGSSVTGIAVNDLHVFYTSESNGEIRRINRDKTNPITLISGLGNPRGLAVDANYIYWADLTTNSIGRANIDGSSPNLFFITTPVNPTGIAVTATHVYWTDDGGLIGRADLDGSNATASYIAPGGGPQSVAVNATHIYWPASGSGIGRANIDGTGVNNTFITGVPLPQAVTLDGTYVYWTDWNDFANSRIGRANLDGSSPNYALATVPSALITNITNTRTAPLPVELVAFEATMSGATAALSWETASETNNAGFAVEHRAPEGPAGAGPGWTEAGFVDGAGTTATPRRYAFSVENLQPGTHAFRLRQVDFDGASTLSHEVEVTVTLDGTHALAVWPNPAASGTVRLSVAAAQTVTVSVYDALGRHVATLFEGPTSGSLEAALPSGLPSGVYLVRAQGETFAETVRVTLAN